MKDIYKVETRPNALAANIVVGDKYRITILTEGLLRLEYSEDGVFEDRATQMVFFRDFPEVEYRVLHTENGIEIHTSRIQMIYNEKEFSSHGLSILSDDIFKICVFTAPAVNLMEKSPGDLRKRQNLQWVRH